MSNQKEPPAGMMMEGWSTIKTGELDSLRTRLSELERENATLRIDKHGLLEGWEQEKGTSSRLRQENATLREERDHYRTLYLTYENDRRRAGVKE